MESNEESQSEIDRLKAENLELSEKNNQLTSTSFQYEGDFSFLFLYEIIKPELRSGLCHDGANSGDPSRA